MCVANDRSPTLCAAAIASSPRGRIECRRSSGGDARYCGRTRARLRAGKIVNAANRFLCECRIHDRSASGLRLVVSRRVRLPGMFCLYEDESGRAAWVAAIWRRGADIGVRYCVGGAPLPLKPSDCFAMREGYYGVVDSTAS